MDVSLPSTEQCYVVQSLQSLNLQSLHLQQNKHSSTLGVATSHRILLAHVCHFLIKWPCGPQLYELNKDAFSNRTYSWFNLRSNLWFNLWCKSAVKVFSKGLKISWFCEVRELRKRLTVLAVEVGRPGFYTSEDRVLLTNKNSCSSFIFLLNTYSANSRYADGLQSSHPNSHVH